jgi:hypothetical protein
MQLGYETLMAVNPHHHVLAVTCIVVAGAFSLAYGVWRFYEPVAHGAFKRVLTALAGRSGLRVSSGSGNPPPAPGPRKRPQLWKSDSEASAALADVLDALVQ